MKKLNLILIALLTLTASRGAHAQLGEKKILTLAAAEKIANAKTLNRKIRRTIKISFLLDPRWIG